MTRAEMELMQMTKERREKAKTRTPWRHRKKAQYKLTNIQKAQRKIAHLDRKETINQMLQDARDNVMELAGEMQKRFPRHSQRYYFHLIMQDSRLNAKSRNPSRWNAFLSQEMERRNTGLTDGRKNVSQESASREIAALWRSMTKEEQVAATEERMLAIAERRSVRKRKIPTAPIQAFHDTRSTTHSIENELRALNVRTGRNSLLIMTSPSATDYGQPYVFHTSPRIVDFIMLTMRSTLPELAIKMEGYILSGVQGIKHNYRQTILALKKEAATIINAKLVEISGGTFTKMMYKNFSVHVTENTGIVVERWPLPVFRAPGDISSSVELQTLIDSWMAGTTYFRMMDEDELREWRCNQRRLEGPSVADGALAGTHDALSEIDLMASSSSLTSSPAPSPATLVMPVVPAPSPDVLAAPAAPASSPAAPASSPLVPIAPVSSPAAPSTLSMFTLLPGDCAPLHPGFPPVATMCSTPSALASAVSPSSPPTPTTSTSVIQTKFVNVNVVTGADGRPLAVSSRQRKTRCDKGTRKRKSADGANSTPLPAASKIRKTVTVASKA